MEIGMSVQGLAVVAAIHKDQFNFRPKYGISYSYSLIDINLGLFFNLHFNFVTN